MAAERMFLEVPAWLREIIEAYEEVLAVVLENHEDAEREYQWSEVDYLAYWSDKNETDPKYHQTAFEMLLGFRRLENEQVHEAVMKLRALILDRQKENEL